MMGAGAKCGPMASTTSRPGWRMLPSPTPGFLSGSDCIRMGFVQQRLGGMPRRLQQRRTSLRILYLPVETNR